MKPILLIDFGSTYTKLTAVDVDAEVILGTAQAYTTVQTDINDGLDEGLRLLEEKTVGFLSVSKFCIHFSAPTIGELSKLDESAIVPYTRYGFG